MLRFALPILCALPTIGLAADYKLTLEHTGFREYYCQNTVTQQNMTSETLTEINGFFLIFDDAGNQVGRSRGASFFNVAAGGSASVVFESPNAPCDTAQDFRFVIGACRFGMGFADKTLCANALAGDAPITDISAP